MQIFANGKRRRRFYSFIKLYGIHLKYQGVKIWSNHDGNAYGNVAKQKV